MGATGTDPAFQLKAFLPGESPVNGRDPFAGSGPDSFFTAELTYITHNYYSDLPQIRLVIIPVLGLLLPR